MDLEANRKYVEEVLLPAKEASRKEAAALPYLEKLKIVARIRSRVNWRPGTGQKRCLSGYIHFARWADHVKEMADDPGLDDDDRRLEVKWALMRMVEDAEQGVFDPPEEQNDEA